MDIKVFSKEELPDVFRVLRTALNPDHELEATEKIFLKTYAKICDYDLPPRLDILATREINLLDPHKRKRLVQLSAMAALLSRPLRKASVEYVDLLAKHLDTEDPVIPVLHAVLKKKKLKARLLTVRRVARMILAEVYRIEGVFGILRIFAVLFLRMSVNKKKLWKYKKLGLLPEGTLGREYWKHITELGFGFPGEPGGIPDTVAYHDVSHVLNDHDTTPAGEIQQGSFQGGSRREGGFGFVQFVILQFHHGIRITPVAAGETGFFDPAKVLWAIYRGSQLNVDVTQGWNYWPLMPLKLEEARAKVGLISPL
jgi:hypothetical protein